MPIQGKELYRGGYQISSLFVSETLISRLDCLFSLSHSYSSCFSQSSLKISSSEWSLSDLDVLLLAGTAGHTLSLAASSFVEEEHQTWYFLLSTLCLAVFQDVCRKYFREKSGPGGDEEEFVLPYKENSKKEIYSEKWLALATPPFVLLCCRLLRSLNQTGVQWAHLPDVGHWLNRWD